MFKNIHRTVWVFDIEWVPDPDAGRLLYHLPKSMSDKDVIKEMWKQGGATDENPMPYLKTVLCRVVSLSVLTRLILDDGEIRLRLLSLPRDPGNPEESSEAHILEKFLLGIGKTKPQLVGFNSYSADLKIMIQRGIAKGIQAAEFCKRPAKPWEGIDYFAVGNDWHIDLMRIVGGYGKSTPSLNEIAMVSGIPGKMGVDGQDVAPLWLDGGLDKIVAYNEFDTITTYLLWLKMAYFGGLFTPEQHKSEQALLRNLLETESEKPERDHLKKYLAKWDEMS